MSRWEIFKELRAPLFIFAALAGVFASKVFGPTLTIAAKGLAIAAVLVVGWSWLSDWLKDPKGTFLAGDPELKVSPLGAAFSYVAMAGWCVGVLVLFFRSDYGEGPLKPWLTVQNGLGLLAASLVISSLAGLTKSRRAAGDPEPSDSESS